MALNANALVTLAEAKAFLKIAGATQDAVVEELINRASDYCEWWCNRPLKSRAFASLRLQARRSTRLYPPGRPIDTSQAVTITVDGTAQTIWKAEADGDPTLKDVMVASDMLDPKFRPNHFYREGGWLGGSAYPTVLTYTGGLATIPGEIKDAAFLVIQQFYRSQEKQLTDIAQLSGSATGFVGFRESLIPMRAKDILASYREVPV